MQPGIADKKNAVESINGVSNTNYFSDDKYRASHS
jgi:hypothetical protein